MQDAEYFFGRDDLTRVLLDRVAGQLSRPGPMVVTGPSGSGKSSLLRAGLLAALQRAAGTLAVALTPGADPLGALAERFAPLDRSHPADLRERIEADPASLRGTLGRAVGGQSLVLIVDQFEEVFAACPDEQQRRAFIRALHAVCAQAGDDRPAGVVVIGVRADFFGHCAAHHELKPGLERAIVVSPMTVPQLREVIEGPAQLAGLALQDGLVELLLDDLSAGTAHAAAPPAASCRCSRTRCWPPGSTGRARR